MARAGCWGRKRSIHSAHAWWQAPVILFPHPHDNPVGLELFCFVEKKASNREEELLSRFVEKNL